MLELGIIGCGRVTTMFHLKAIQQLEKIKIHSIADINKDRMSEVKSDCGATYGYLDYKQLLEDEDIEAVTINTPPQFHEEMVLDALHAGKHVLCEKPLAKTVEGCIRIRKKQKETGLVVLPAHNYTFSPSLYQMRKLIRDNSIGEINGIEVAFENLLKSYRSQTDFRETSEEGIVEDVLPHILSVIYPIAGHIEDVDLLKWWCKDYDVCDNMNFQMNTKTGIVINSEMSWTKIRPRFSLKVNGTNGFLHTDLMFNPYKVDIIINGKTNTWKAKGIRWYFDLVQFKHPSFKKQYEHFHDLVNEGGSPMIDIDDEINMLKTMTKILEKMDS